MAVSQEPETDTGNSNATSPSALARKARHRLRNLGAVIASIAAVGAVIGGLAGYLNAWNAIKANVQPVVRLPQSAEIAVSRAPTVAVLPFANQTGDAAQDTFSDGLTQQMIADLTKFPGLRVLGQGIASANKDNATESRDLARQFGADYVVGGDLRKAADTTRVMVRLDNAHTGDRVWSRAFDAKAGADGFLSAADDIAARTAAILGGFAGVVANAEYPRIQKKPLAELTPYECIVQGIMTAWSPLPEAYQRARTCLESLVAKEPTNSDAWAALTIVYGQQRFLGIGLPAEEAANIEKRAYLADKALVVATKAVDLAPNDSYTHVQLAYAYALHCDLDRLWAEARRAIELNPYNPNIYGMLGYQIVQLGDTDAGAAMVEKGIAMTARNNPRVWWRAIWNSRFRRGEYQQAYEAGLRSFVDQSWGSHLDMAATLVALDRMDDAKAEIVKVLKLKPGLTIRQVDTNARAFCSPAAAREKYEAFLRKAGLPE